MEKKIFISPFTNVAIYLDENSKQDVILFDEDGGELERLEVFRYTNGNGEVIYVEKN